MTIKAIIFNLHDERTDDVNSPVANNLKKRIYK